MSATVVTDDWTVVRDYLFGTPAGRDDERVALWEAHRGIARVLARRWRPHHLEREDVQQEAQLALWKATGSWDKSRYPSFVVYAFEVIKSHMAVLYARGRARKVAILTDSVRVATNAEGESVPVVELMPGAVRSDMADIATARQLLRQLLAAWPLLTEGEQQAVRDAMNHEREFGTFNKSDYAREYARLRRAQAVILAPEARQGLSEPVNGHRPSLDERREVVARLRAEGHTNQEIAERLGIARNTVNRDVAAAGCAPGKTPGPRLREIRAARSQRDRLVLELRARGESQQAIADALGVSRSLIGVDLKRLAGGVDDA